MILIMKKAHIFFGMALLFSLFSCGYEKVYYGSDFGIIPGTGEDMTEEFAKAFETIKAERNGTPAVLLIDNGEYDFYPDSANVREYYISNHDQDNPKRVAIALEGMKNFTLKGRMKDNRLADLMMNGRMLPVAMVNCENCKLEYIGVDTRVPQITQVEVLENDAENGYITYRIAPYVNYRVDNGRLVVYGSNWEFVPCWGIAFEGDTKRIVYTTSDIGVGTSAVEEISPRVIRAAWRDARLKPGTVIAMRSFQRPTPGIFVSECKNTTLFHTAVYYAEGMGLLAQMSENITLEGFKVAIRENVYEVAGGKDPLGQAAEVNRYFTTQADATHFSGCKGKLTSNNGFYEGMMDDAINVHGTYLRVTQRLDDNTLVGRYMHGQAYGFYWGGAGDSVQFVRSDVMEITEGNKVVEITPYDKSELKGCKEFKITFEKPLPEDIANGKYGIENLEWTPEVVFNNNLIRNNRARGALFSTPKKTVVENNVFDHTSGTAILLCGDCNGWFETGACRDVVIRNNRFINALTSMFQFTNGVISIYPEIPDLASQTKYFHGGNGKGVVIENNLFETFDAPIVYAKSIDGLVFRNNKIVQNEDFKPFHWNKYRFLLEKTTNVTIENNDFDGGFDKEKDVMYRY